MGTIHRIHLDPIGGIAGDMFIAALLDAFPDLVSGLLQEVRKIPAPKDAELRLAEHRGGGFGGKRFIVSESGAVKSPSRTAEHHHHHVSHQSIRHLLAQAPLASQVRMHALQMFALLAEAEAKVHGIRPEEVTSHEVGAWDSLVDFVGTAFLIDALNPSVWSWAPVPLGSGRVTSAHGILPVPAPATTLLLQGLTVLDDGVPGERVTPTGATILRYLRTFPAAPPGPMIASATGFGFGQRALAGLPNILRCIAFEAADRSAVVLEEDLGVIQFEVDDQSGEDLGIALDHIRDAPGVREVYQLPVYGKKGRLAMQVQVQADPTRLDSLAHLCFEETTTLGLRIQRVWRKSLPRENVGADEATMPRVKVADRPSGKPTAKAEADDLAALVSGRAAREDARREAERRALAKRGSRGRQDPQHD